MKLFLSSQDFGNHLDRLHAMVGSDKRVLFVENAKDYYAPAERAAHVKQKKREFESAGFEFFELDLRNYFKSPDKLKPIIDAAHFIFVSGGNSFILRRAFAYSGFDSLIMNALKTNDLTYAGSSAGSVIMCKTLRGYDTMDAPYVVPAEYKEDIIWNGLGLIYPQLIVHFKSERFGEVSQATLDNFEHNGLKYETLQDGEVYVVDGKYEEKLT